MHCIEVIKHLNTRAAIAGVSRRAKEARKGITFSSENHEHLADLALDGSPGAWEAMVEILAQREAD